LLSNDTGEKSAGQGNWPVNIAYNTLGASEDQPAQRDVATHCPVKA